MRKILLLSLLLGFTNSIWAQYDPEAKKILDAMSAYYKEIPSYSASFTNSMTNESEGLDETNTGTVKVKGESYYLNLGEQEIYSNGTTVWTYIADIDEVNITSVDPDEEDIITPNKIYNLYTQGFKYMLMGETTVNGIACYTIDLVPEDGQNKEFFKVKLLISKANKTLVQWAIYDKMGGRYTFKIDNFKKEAIPDKDFQFNASAYPNVEEVDLR